MRTLPGIGSHHSARLQTDEWLTPPEVLKALGGFDLDPCCPVDMARHRKPWSTAEIMLSVEDDGLDWDWMECWEDRPAGLVGALVDRPVLLAAVERVAS